MLRLLFWQAHGASMTTIPNAISSANNPNNSIGAFQRWCNPGDLEWQTLHGCWMAARTAHSHDIGMIVRVARVRARMRFSTVKVK